MNNLVYAFVFFGYLLEMEARAAMKIPRLKDMTETHATSIYDGLSQGAQNGIHACRLDIRQYGQHLDCKG